MTIGQCLDHTLEWQATHANAIRPQCAEIRAATVDVDKSQADFESYLQHMKDMFQDMKDMLEKIMAKKAAKKDAQCSCTNTPCTCMENRRDQKDI